MTCKTRIKRNDFNAWQVPLTDDSECEGGHLLFACGDGRLMHVKRRVGSIMAHDGDAVHGVTRLVKGIRCELTTCHSGNRRRVELFTASTIFEPFFPPYPFLTPTLPPARYGLYALRGRQPAPLPPPLHIAQGNEAAHSDRLQVCGVGNGVLPVTVTCLLQVVPRGN